MNSREEQNPGAQGGAGDPTTADERLNTSFLSRRKMMTAGAIGAGAALVGLASQPARAAIGIMPTDEVFNWREAMMIRQAETVNTSSSRRAEYGLYHNPNPNAPAFDAAQNGDRLIPVTPGERFLVLDNRRGDVFSGVYFRDGTYVQSALQQISYLFRDRRNNEVRRIDPKLIDVIFSVQKMLDTREPVQLVSGFRSAATNAMLAAQSSRVARNSYHIRGMAADVRIPGRSVSGLRSAALSMRTGGIGTYPNSDYVHLDTGPFRSW
ncbi:MAG: YcbK family protein [Alphaproteobacteria bacterium]